MTVGGVGGGKYTEACVKTTRQKLSEVKCFMYLNIPGVSCNHKLNILKICNLYSSSRTCFRLKNQISQWSQAYRASSQLFFENDEHEGEPNPITQHVTSNVRDLMQFSTLLIFYLIAVCFYYFCLPLLFCDENPAVKIQVNSFYSSSSCCCSVRAAAGKKNCSRTA